jgi:hypothetical protein
VKLVVAASAPVDALPFAALAPLQPPEAVQPVAFVEFQLRVDVPPLGTLLGLAESETDGGAGGTMTPTETVWLTSPPAPAHVNVKSVGALSAPVSWLPFTVLLPVQPPEAVQLVALLVLQVSVAGLPTTTLAGLAASVRVGAGDVLTTTVTVWLVVPPAPLQLSVKLDVAVSAPVAAVPASGLSPLQLPEALQLVALVELQASAEDWPLATAVGLAFSAIVGAAATLTLTETVRLVLPPGPEQDRVKSVGAFSAPVESLPLSGLLPLQPPEAEQLVASVAVQARLAAAPLATSAGLTVRPTVGAGVGSPPVESVLPEPPQAHDREAQRRTAAKVRIEPIFSLKSTG